MPTNIPLIDPDAIKHRWYEDVLGLGSGVVLCWLGLHLLAGLGLFTGQIAGLAMVVALMTGLPFAALFVAISLPFYIFGARKMGWAFTVKSLVCVAGVGAASALLPPHFAIAALHPALGVITFAVVTSVGLIAIFRHGGSLGGIGILALYAQDRGWMQAGTVQLLFDIALFAVAAVFLPFTVLAWSLAGVVVLNITIILNHRRDRYIA